MDLPQSCSLILKLKCQNLKMTRQSSQNVLLLLAPYGRMLSKTTSFLICRPVRNSISEPCNVKKLTKRPHCPHTASKTDSNRRGLPHVVLNGLQNGQIATSLRLALRQDPADFVFSSSLARRRLPCLQRSLAGRPFRLLQFVALLSSSFLLVGA